MHDITTSDSHCWMATEILWPISIIMGINLQGMDQFCGAWNTETSLETLSEKDPGSTWINHALVRLDPKHKGPQVRI